MEVFNMQDVVEYFEHQNMRIAGSIHTTHLLNMTITRELRQVF